MMIIGKQIVMTTDSEAKIYTFWFNDDCCVDVLQGEDIYSIAHCGSKIFRIHHHHHQRRQWSVCMNLG